MKISKKIALYVSWSLLSLTALYMHFAPEVTPMPLKAPFAQLPYSIDGWIGRESETRDSFTAAIVSNLGADDLLMRRYENAGGDKLELYLSYFNYTKAHKGPHAPQLCWVGGGWALKNLGEEDLDVSGIRYPAIKIRKILGEKLGNRVLLLYTYKINDKYAGDLMRFRIITVLDSIFRRKNYAFTLQLYSRLGGEDAHKKEGAMNDFLVKVFGLLEKDFLP